MNNLGGQQIKDDFVVIVGGGLVGLELMEILGEEGKKLMVVEMTDKVANGLPAYLIQHQYWQFDKYHVHVRKNTKCVEVGKDFVILESESRQEKIDCSEVIARIRRLSTNMPIRSTKRRLISPGKAL